MTPHYPDSEVTVHAKALRTLEFPKILDRLAQHTSFSAGHELALALTPSTDFDEVFRRQQATTQARRLLDLKPGLNLGGVHDLRPLVQRARILATLDAMEFLDILTTLQAGRRVCAVITRLGDQLPVLAAMAEGFADCPALENEIARCITDRGEVADAASPALGRIRSELQVAHSRLMSKLQEYVSGNAATALQEPIITQRGDRYVLPVKAEARAHFRGIVHDQSASGATLFMEPLAVVEVQNRWRKLQLDERQEIERILRQLTGLVGAQSDLLEGDVIALAELDLALAKSLYSEAIRGTEPGLVDPASAPSGESRRPGRLRGDDPWRLELRSARHPLLDPSKVVPSTVTLGGGFRILVITGPNTGGKTVSLKTVGLLCLMAQAGLHIPAMEGSQAPVFQSIHADIGDEQSIEQSLSTFSGHLSNIVEILTEAGPRSLVLLDELGAGTDPVEGAALARSILGDLLAKRSLTLVATHYAELKTYAQITADVQNASVEFNVETLSPTYRLTIGLPGQSNALAIAERLGLPADIIVRARSLLSPAHLQAERLLGEIQKDHQDSIADRAAAVQARAEADKMQRELADRLRGIEEERHQTVAQARWKAEAEVEEVRQRLRQVLLRSDAPPQRQTALAALEELRAISQSLPPPPRPERPVLLPSPRAPLAVGAPVWVRSLDQDGVLLSPPDERGEAEVQVGSFKMRLAASDLEGRADKPPEARSYAGTSESVMQAAAVSLQLDLRGYRAEEVAPVLEQYLNDAYLGGLPYVRIVHGKGTGVLRQVVREILDGHALVKEFHTADQKEGGEGATVAVMATG
jgi:DNA mismatch repair protein MutS2